MLLAQLTEGLQFPSTTLSKRVQSTHFTWQSHTSLAASLLHAAAAALHCGPQAAPLAPLCKGSWPTGPEGLQFPVKHTMSAEKLLSILASRYSGILGDNFVGMYVHGSYAMGCFNAAKSDLDYIILCDDEPDADIKKQIMDVTIAYERFAPAKGLEMHLMRRCDCAEYIHPPYFCLHYSGAHTLAYLSDPDNYISYMHGQDMDLGAHLTVLTNRGKRIAGPEIPEVFGAVPKYAYIESVMSDMDWSDGDCMYHVLNRCRTLALMRDGLVLSKKEGALWALENVEKEHHPVITEALHCYETDAEMTSIAAAEKFCQKALDVIKSTLPKNTGLTCDH